MRIIVLGPPGVGKGTQSQILETRYRVWQVSTGDLLRVHRTEGTELGKQAAEYMDRGALVPDSLIIAMVEVALRGVESFILDGFPRTLPQAQALDELLKRLKSPLDSVLLLKAPREVLVARLTSRWINPRNGRSYNTISMPPKVAGIDDEDGGLLEQRIDDLPETVEKRLDVFDQQTAPLIEYYRSTGKLVEINADQAVDKITEEILAGIKEASGMLS